MLGSMKAFNSICLSRLVPADLLRHEGSRTSRPLSDTFFLYFGLSVRHK